MTTEIKIFKKPRLKNPVLIEGLPGVGNVGRIAAGYLIEELKAEKFAELISSHFMPLVLVREDGTSHLLRNEFFYWKAKKKNQRDLIILIGDSQSVDPEGHYEIVHEILKFAKKLKVKEIITLGGLSIGERVEEPKVIAVANSPSVVKKYKKYGIYFDNGRRVSTIVGAAGLLIGLGRYYGIEGLCLLGETMGVPLLPDHKSAEAVLRVVNKILNLKIDLSKLEEKVEKMKKFVKKMTELQTSLIPQLSAQKPKKEEQSLSYIG